MDESIIRARSTIFELAYCNEWEYFITMTVDSKKYDREDLNKYHRAFAQWIKNLGREDYNIKYLTIPERHKKGGWHEHGFISGIPPDKLREFNLDEKLPYYIRDKLVKGNKIYDWGDYRDKFGFVNLEPIHSREGASKYVTKYIKKNLATSIKQINAHLYYCSNGLKRAVEIKRGKLVEGLPWDFENEYIKLKWFENELQALKTIV